MDLSGKVSVLKDGKLLMANKYTARTFKDINRARNFVRNLIWVSKNLTPTNFQYIKG